MRVLQWMLRAGKHGDVGLTEFRCVERIAAGSVNIHVSRNGGNGENLNVGRAQRHDQRNGVVGSSVGINQERKFHVTQDNKLAGESLNKSSLLLASGGTRELRQLVLQRFGYTGSTIFVIRLSGHGLWTPMRPPSKRCLRSITLAVSFA